jgi:hypothetical protein
VELPGIGEEKLIYSLDAGSTWTAIPTPDGSLIFDIIFPDSLHGFAVGRGGAIIKYIPPIINFVKEIEEGIPESFFLFQNYPNPFNPITKISYILPEESNVTLSIYNTLGETVEVLVNEVQSAKGYEAVWNAGANPSGVYFYSIEISLPMGGEYFPNPDCYAKIKKFLLTFAICKAKIIFLKR